MRRIAIAVSVWCLAAGTVAAVAGQELLGPVVSPEPQQSAETVAEPGVASPLAEIPIGPSEVSYPVMETAPPGPQPWQLPQPRLFDDLGIDMGGWVQQGITYNAVDPSDGFNGPVPINDRDGEYQLNQAWLYFVKPTKTDGCGWDVGGRIDLVYGTDWRYGMVPGLEDHVNSQDNFYGWVFPQFYMEVAVNDLTVKMGHYGTLVSYEVIPAVGNFFYSHCYLMSGYFDPLLVTGLQAEYQLNDNWTLVSGFHRGWLMFEDNNEEMDYLGGLRWKSDDKATTLSMMVDTGAQDAAGLNNRTTYMLVFSQQLGPNLTYALQHNLGFEDDGSLRTAGDDAEWYGVCQWLTYKINDKWSAGARAEWVRDDDGSRIGGLGNYIGSDKGWLGLPGFAGNFYDISLGLNYRPCPNLVLRPEVRWDWYEGTTNLAGELPFDNGNDDDQFLVAMDMIFTF